VGWLAVTDILEELVAYILKICALQLDCMVLYPRRLGCFQHYSDNLKRCMRIVSIFSWKMTFTLQFSPPPPPFSYCVPDIEVCVCVCRGSISIVKMKAVVYFCTLARSFFSSTTKGCLLHETVSFYIKTEDYSHIFFCLDSVQEHMGIF
jgi:hypothetical protein